MAQSNWSGWLLARTSINLYTNTEKKYEEMNQYRAVVIGNLGIEKQKKHALQKFSISSSKVKRKLSASR